MVNSSPQTQVYCTRPSCQHPLNPILEECLTPGSIRQRFCSCCGMPLILDGRFLTLQLLIPDRERGGFGRTFLAQDLSFPHRPLRVIKQLHPQIPHGRSKLTPEELETIEKMFQREATVLARFQHVQIPRAWAFFTLEVLRDLQEISTQEPGSQQKLFYLVQDYIEGQNLAQELQQNGQFSGREIINILKQILPILHYVHNDGAIHRDIKPSNIMRCSSNGNNNGRLYLIDFGAVKQVSVVRVPTEQSCILGTPDYAPPEQFSGRAVSASSDLYSLAATCVYLLTAKKSRELRNQEDKWNWQRHVNVTDHLASILNRMLLPLPEDRFQSAQEVLTALSSVEDSKPIEVIESPKSTRRPAPTPLSIFQRVKRITGVRRFAFFVLATLSAFLIGFINYLITPPACSQYECEQANSFSWGEQILLQPTFEVNAAKKAGTEAFYQGKYNEAINKFQEYLKSNRNDPEALIYLNNAYAARTNNPIRIAVAVPIITNRRIDEEMLRGVAHVQSEFNCSINNKLRNINNNIQLDCNQTGIKNRFLQILIANDKQDSAEAQKVAQNLVNNKNILGVIGHFTSQVTSDVALTYGNGELVAIAPTSTVPRNSYGLKFHKNIFRTAPTDKIAARSLVDYMKRKGYSKATIVIDNDTYAKSVAEEFKTILEAKGGTVIGNYCNLVEQGFRLEKCLQKAQIIDSKVNVLFLALTDEVSQKVAGNIYSNSLNMNIIGGDGMYNAEQLKADINRIGQEKLVIAVPWHRSESERESPFEKSSRQLWNGALVNWRTAMTYDATKAMVEGLNKLGNNPTRSGLYEQLSKKEFSIQGATGKVEFDENHDRKPFKGIGVLVHVKPNADNKPVFVRLEQPNNVIN